MKKLGLLSILSLLSVTLAFGQAENCSNGVDDDGDGFIDCYDGDCANNAACSGSFLGNDVLCQAKPSKFPQFTMKLKWQSPNQTTNHLNRASVGDLDGDGIPEVVVNEIVGKKIYILNGKDGTVKKSLAVSYSLQRDPLIGWVTSAPGVKEPTAWIFANDGSQYIYAYDANLTLKWQSTAMSGDPSLMGLADFDNDGMTELYCRDEILAAESGIRIVKGTNTSNAAGGPVAVDILDAAGNVAGTGDNKLELVSGCKIFSVDLGGRTLNSGSLTLAKSLSTYFYWEKNGNTSLTSVVDYNQDGFLDVIATGSTNAQSKNATAFFWDVNNNVGKTYIDASSATVKIAGCSNTSGTYYKNGWQNGLGRINIADIDADGKLNASYISGKYMYALDENWNQKWRIQVNEETSGYTGCTVYDFNGDGAAEVVYRDEQYIYIINGTDGSLNTQQQCIARTNFEYPVVADVDNDGQTELCVTCGYDDKLAWSNFCNLSYSQNACVRVFSSASVPWVPSRKLWNQHGYFNVNVNDNLTIPQVMQKQGAIFSSGVCTIGSNRALNTYLNQSPFLDSKGCPTYAAPHLINVQSSFVVTPPVCPDKNFTVSMGIQNLGDAAINTNVPITFYDGDPTKPGAIKLNTVNIPVNLPKNSPTIQTFPSVTVNGTGGNFTLYVSVNDAGTTSLPLPHNVNLNPNIIECSYDDPLGFDVIPANGHVVALNVNDNVKCIGAAVPDNGAVKAYFDLGGGLKDTINYTFKWYNGAAVGAPNYTGQIYSGLPAGTYSVIAVNTASGCTSDVGQATVNQVGKAPFNVAIVVDQASNSCGSPNGKFHAVVNGGDPVTNYTFAWYEGNNIFTSPQIGTGYIASSLKGGVTYTVLVTDNASGCQSIQSLPVPNNTVTPNVQASASPAICVPANSGSASANVGGITTGYTFNWYNGTTTKPATDFVGPNYGAIPAGSYTVVAIEDATGCPSPASTVVVTSPPQPAFVVNANMQNQQTSCSLASPNGSVTADVGGATAGYNFSWFKGQSTAAVDAVPGSSGLASGTYTVLATDNSTGCTATDTAIVTQKLIYPVVNLTPSSNSICDPAKGYTGSVAASVTYGGAVVGIFTNYSFVWYNGATTASPVIASASGSTLNQLNGGSYTLVVTRTDLGCAAPPATATVINATVLPTITTSVSGSKNCAGGTPDGSITVTGVAPADTYSYRWFDPTNAPIVGQTGSTLGSLQGGVGQNYKVEVTLNSTGCLNTAINTVPDNKVLPQVTLTEIDNSVCDPLKGYTGKITTVVNNQVGAITNYGFVLSGGMGAGVQLASPNHNQFTKLNGGAVAYTVTTTQISTNCSSSSNITVNNNQVLPTITTTVLGSKNCAGGTLDGSMTVSGVVPADTYSYRWFDPTNTLIVGQTGATLGSLQGGAGQNYKVEVTLNSTGCLNTASQTVPDNKAQPTLTLTAQPSTICDPSKAPLSSGKFDGQVSAAINTIGNYAASVPSDFTFTWSTSPIGVVGQNILLNQDVGTYTVSAVHNTTNCPTILYSATITNAKKLPTITMAQTPSTNCSGGTADGVAQVTNVLPNGMNYSYNWYNGNAVAGVPNRTVASTTSTSDNYSGVQGGLSGVSLQQYTVEVTILQTGCINSETVGVDDDSQVPIISKVTPTDNTNCGATKNGSATVTSLSYRGSAVPAASYSGYNFVWSGTGTQGPPETFTALAAGTYSVTAQNNTSKCTSNPVSVTIADDLVYPTIDVVSVNQTSCDLAHPNGKLTATIDETPIGGSTGVTAGYTFTWVDNVTLSSTSSNVISNLKGNQDYTITAVKNSTQCSSSQISFLIQKLVIPTVTVAVTNMTTCAPYNGKLVATPAPGAIATYDYFWYDGNNAADEATIVAANNTGLIGVVSTNTYDKLFAQDYTVVVRDKSSQCLSSQVIKTVANSAPAINPVAENTALPATCLVSGGVMTAAVRTTALKNFTAVAATDQLTIGASIGLGLGDKIIIARNGALALPGGLLENQTYFIESLSGGGTIITLKDSGGAHIDITTNGDGTISNFVTAGYTYTWYQGVPSGVTPANPINYFTNPPNWTALTPPAASSGSVYNNLQTGLYSVEVMDNATGCKNFISQTLPFLGSQAVIKISKTNSQVCSPPNADNGSITIEIEDPAGGPYAAGYEVSLLKGAAVIAGPITPVTAASTQITGLLVSSSLSPQTYVVRVKQNYGFGCLIDQDVIIGRDAFAPVISLTAPVVSNTACSNAAYNGRIDLNVSLDSNDKTTGTTFSMNIVPDPNLVSPVAIPVSGNYSATSLGPNSYTFSVTASTGCSASKTFTVIDNPTKSLLTTGNITISNAEYCDVSLEKSAKAEITEVDIVGAAGAEKINDYQFDWYTNATLTTKILSAVGNALGKGGQELSNVGAPLPSQKITNSSYWVVATKMTDLSGTGGIGCASTALSLTIGSDKVNPQVVLTPSGDPACVNNVYQGSITVDAKTASGPGAVIGVKYDYTWAPTGAAGQPANSTGNSGTANVQNAINDGSYSVTVLNEATGCSVSSSTTVLKVTPPVFTLSANVTNETKCGPFDGLINGLQVFADGVPGVLTDFNYVWYRTDLSTKVLDGQVVGNPTAETLSITNYAGIGLDKYFVKAIRSGGGSGIGCESAPLRKDILDDRAYPQVTMSSVANDACTSPNWDGAITLTAGTVGYNAGTKYDFTWTAVPATAGVVASNGMNVSSVAPIAPSTISLASYSSPGTDRIGAGDYTIHVLNQSNGCTTDATVTVEQNTVAITAAATALPRMSCTAPDGSVTLTGIKVGGATANAADFSYSWSNAAVTANQAGLDTGSYTLTVTKNSAATNRTAYGCVSSPTTVSVIDNRTYPIVTLSSVANDACTSPNWDGSIKLTAGTENYGAGTVYDFTWTSVPGTAGIVASNGMNISSVAPVAPSTISLASYATLAGDRIGGGNYSVQVLNHSNGCKTDASVTVVDDPKLLQVFTFSKQDQMICNPDGRITVLTLNSGVPADYTFAWYLTDPTTAQLVDFASTPISGSTLQAGGAAGQYQLMGAGSYYVQGTKNPGKPGAGCSTAPFKIDIKDLHTNPVIAAATIAANTNCTGAAIGVGSVTINEATPANYTYNWFTGDDITGAPVAVAMPGNAATNLLQGDYTVQVRSNATNCVSIESFTVPTNPTIVGIDPAGFSAPAIGTCVLATGVPSNGSATVTTILENNVSQSVAGYSFLWKDALNNTLLNGPATLNNIPVGKYFVTATNTTSSCFVDFSFDILDQTKGTTSVSLIDFNQPQRCVDPRLGYLTVQGGGTVAGPFTYQWYAGDQRPSPAGAPLVAPGPPMPSANMLSNIPAVAGQIFTVKAINSNNCWAVDAYSVPLITNQVVLSTSSNPQTYCTSNNGEAFVTTVNDIKFNYTFLWAKGNTVNPPVDYTGNDIPNLPAGDYTVVAVDNRDATCLSAPIPVTVDLKQVTPTVETKLINGLTICDPTRPDGIAEADVAGDVSHYTFDWSITSTGAPFGSGAVVSGMDSTKYTVIATDIVSGCTGSATIKIPANFAPMFAPTITVLSNVTICRKPPALHDNGRLGATVNGNTSDYIFDWANGKSAPPPIAFTGNFYDSLSVGEYTVIATSRITGCVSSPATAPIILDQKIPDFVFTVEGSVCPDNPDKLSPVPSLKAGTGYVTLLVNDNLPVSTITWYHEDGTLASHGSNLEGALPGKYKATVVTTLGCENTKEVDVPVEISVYNGISRRSDSHNNYFAITCIQQFERNHVEIFNRAGTKVYEADHYDNNNVLFDGKSNQGVNLMGNNLPAGTYFYVISKGDGSEKIVGYLELVD